MAKIDFGKDFGNSINIYLEYFGKLVPFFAFILALTVISQVVLLIGGSLAGFSLFIEEKIPVLFSAFNAGEFEQIFDILLGSPAFLVILGLTFVVMTLVSLIGYSLIYGGLLQLIKETYSNSKLSISNGLIGAKKFFKRILILHIVLLLLVGFFISSSYILIDLNLFIGILYSLGVILVFLVIYFCFFSFAKEALVVGNLGVVESLRKNFVFFKNNIPEVIFYYIIFVLAIFTISSFNLVFSRLLDTTIQGLINVLIIFLIYPFFAFLKMNLFSDYIGLLSKTNSKRDYLFKARKGFNRSIKELIVFTKKNIPKIFLAFIFLFVGAVIGWYLGNIIPQIELSQIGGVNFSSSIFFHLMFHNFSAATGILFSGIIFGLPTIGALLFNGVVIGIVSTYVGGLDVFLVGILPHGIIEIPSLCIAGAMGLKLGLVTLNYFREKENIEKLGKQIEKLFYGVIGIFPLFMIAALIESLITPYLLSLIT